MRRRWLLLAGAGVALLLWGLARLGEPPAELLLQRASFGETIDDEAARDVALPHRWQADCADCRTVWYRFELPRAEPPREAQAIYLRGVAHNAAVYLNGRLLGSGGRFSDPVARLGARALLLAAPVPLWTSGPNRLYVLVKAEQAPLGRMPAPALGAEALLQPLERWHTLLAVTLPQVLATAAVMLGVVMGVLWFYRRREADYLALAGATTLWAVHAFSGMVLEPPWLAPWWDAWLGGTRALATVALLALALRAAGHGTPRLPLGLAATALFGAALAGPIGAMAEPAVLAAAGALLAHAGWCAREERRLLCGLALLLAAAADGLSGTLALLPLVVGAWFAVAGWQQLLGFVQTLNAVELLNIDLEALVQARTAELHAQFERVRELERHQLVAAERERLMRDMHDGVGGQLVSLLAMIEADRRRPGELATAVRDALDDMRLMVDSLDPVDDDLNAVLAMLHDRLAPRMRLAGVALQWDVALLAPLPGLTPARVLHVLRILQEAVTNAIRHGRARHLWFSAADAHDGATLVLRDDGSGFDGAAQPTGRGLKNMHRRAAECGAGITVDSVPGQGTTVTLRLPRR